MIRRHCTSLLLILLAIVVDQLQIPLVTCQEEEDTQCLPRKTFLAFLRLPEVSSNLAAYSRSARVIQDGRNDFMHLKALSTEDTSDDTKICLPAEVYYEIFSDPTMRAHLSVIERAQRMVEDPEHDVTSYEAEKRSIATLAKNDDLPASIQERYQGEDGDDDEKRSQTSMAAEEILKMYAGHTPEELGKSAESIINDYTLPSGEIDIDSLTRDFHNTKRNVGALARDYALPSGRRNRASSSDSQDSSSQSNKRNIAMLARDRLLPKSYKRNIGSLGRVYIVPSYQGKRNIATLARDSMLPMGKRYLGALVKSGGYPYIYNKRNIASLARNGLYNYVKRNIGTLARDWNLPQSRHSRSLSEKELGAARIDLDNLQRIDYPNHPDDHHNHELEFNKLRKGSKFNKNKSLLESELVDAKNKSRSKRQIDYSEEYPLPVMQNANVLDYDDFMEALIAGYPIAEKRFMGAGSGASERHENGDANDDGTNDDKSINQSLMGYQDVYQPSKRHIGALARLGWLPSFRAARFSRSPRYLVGRPNSSDGSSADDSPNTQTRSLDTWKKRLRTRDMHYQNYQGCCRHGFRKYLSSPSTDDVIFRASISDE